MLKSRMLLVAATLLAGCTEARIGVPAELAGATEQLPLTGIGGWRGGHFRIGNSQGSFTRRADQRRLFGFVRDRGMASFDASGPEFGGSAAGWCAFAQGEFDAGVAVLPNGRLNYRCEFDRGGQMFLVEVPYGSGLLAGRSRAGEIRLGGTTVEVKAIHTAPGMAVPTGTPLGYSFRVGGRQIGAVNLNGAKAVYAPRQPGPERDAVLMGSIALALFWDPGA